ncbi:MAG TPA: twin-arginine translocase TatA/TatE family subunit [Thermomicrobiales bacterium]|jgi:sec-independent protein translocase protein TatA|nr:twin-arginine translocase TatA/TatE family subunit [Thermomicrobiales bacterium]
MPSLGPTELIIILVIVVLIFGASRIGDIGGALGRGIKEFKENTQDDKKLDAGKADDYVTPTSTTTVTRREEPVRTSSSQQVRADEV